MNKQRETNEAKKINNKKKSREEKKIDGNKRGEEEEKKRTLTGFGIIMHGILLGTDIQL